MPDLKLIPKTSFSRSLWKNGLGHTDQIAIFPKDANLSRGDFLWRVSSARINQASDFSLFPHHDRVLVILDGHGVRLSHKFDEESDPDIVEIGRLDPYEFPGDVPSRCDLIDGPVTDLSVFFRKGEIEAKVEVVVIDSTFDWQPTGKWNLIFVQSGSLSINDQTIQMGDVGFLECITGNQDGSIPITAELSGTTLVLTELTDL